LGRGFAVAEKAQGTEVIEIALASAFGYGADVVGVPETAAGGNGLHSVEAQPCCTSRAPRSFKGVVGSGGIDAADEADAVVAGEDLIAEVAGVGAETPLVNTVVGAEGSAAFGYDFEFAPAAQGQAVRA
jgi:hypothetical protein